MLSPMEISMQFVLAALSNLFNGFLVCMAAFWGGDTTWHYAIPGTLSVKTKQPGSFLEQEVLRNFIACFLLPVLKIFNGTIFWYERQSI